VKERPILFSGPMVRAILAGKKTQTRRVLKPQPIPQHHVAHVQDRGDWRGAWCVLTNHAACVDQLAWYAQPGDRLWVRETFALSVAEEDCEDRNTKDPSYWDPPVYKADAIEGGEWTDAEGKPIPPPWRPSIHMPRWASRLTLEVTGVRVERLQAIGEDDARAEGVTLDSVPGSVNGEPAICTPMSHAVAFAWLWDSINGKRAPWASNPWVWVIEFKRVP
jgi:hypothetical protein